MNGKKLYKQPPIVERVIGVYTKIKPEVFEAKMPEWVAKIRSEYPMEHSLAEWSLNIKQVDGVPLLQNSTPTAEIIRVFWKKHPQQSLVHGMRLRPSRLVFHLCRDGAKVHDFEELYAAMDEWIGRWMEHFEVPHLLGVTAEYFNRLNAAITPQFMTPDRRLALADAVVMFANIPGKYQTITPPYDCRMRLVVDEARPCHFDLRIRADDSVDLGVRVDFMATTMGGERSISARDGLAEIRLCHDVILEQFDCFFTEKAKSSFLPNGISDANPSDQPS